MSDSDSSSVGGSLLNEGDDDDSVHTLSDHYESDHEEDIIEKKQVFENEKVELKPIPLEQSVESFAEQNGIPISHQVYIYNIIYIILSMYFLSYINTN